MRESIGSVFLYNIIFMFLAIIFSFLMGTLIYHKAFIVNSKIILAIEKYEGYNKHAIDEINIQLNSIGYSKGWDTDCPLQRRGLKLQPPTDRTYKYCVYLRENDGSNNYYSYGVVTYIKFDIPIIGGILRIPIYAESSRIYRFNT